MPHTFPCDAGKLLEIIASDYGRHKWFHPEKMAKIHATFLKLIDRIYGNEAFEMALCALPDQYRWERAAKIVLFGKENGVPRDDWVMALGIQVARSIPK